MPRHSIDPDQLDQVTLKRHLHYDPETGIFRSNYGKKRRLGCIHYVDGRPYRRIAIGMNGRKRDFYEHRLAYLYMTGEWPEHTIDHRDGDGCNSKWDNLRPATKRQNMWNMRTPITNTSGAMGIYPTKSGKYIARMRRDHLGLSPHLGTFGTAAEAIAARDAAIERYRDGIKFVG